MVHHQVQQAKKSAIVQIVRNSQEEPKNAESEVNARERRIEIRLSQEKKKPMCLVLKPKIAHKFEIKINKEKDLQGKSGIREISPEKIAIDDQFIRIGKYLYDKDRYTEEELDKIRRGEYISGDLIYRNRHIPIGKKDLSHLRYKAVVAKEKHQESDKTTRKGRMEDIYLDNVQNSVSVHNEGVHELVGGGDHRNDRIDENIMPIMPSNGDESSSCVNFDDVLDSSNSSDESSYNYKYQSSNIFEFIIKSLIKDENALTFLKLNAESYKKKIIDSLNFSGIMRAVHYFCGVGNSNEYGMIDLIFCALLFRLKMKFDIFTFLNRTFKHLKIEDEDSFTIVFTKNVLPISRATLLSSCVEIDEVNKNLDIFLEYLVRNGIWVLFMSVDGTHSFDLDTIEIRGLPKVKKMNTCGVLNNETGETNERVKNDSMFKKNISHLAIGETTIEENAETTHMGYDIDAFCGAIYPQNIGGLKFNDEICIKTAVQKKNPWKSNLVVTNDREFHKLHEYYFFVIGLVDSGIGPIHITVVTNIKYNYENRIMADQFLKSLNKRIKKYSSVTERDPISVSVSNSRVDENFFKLNRFRRNRETREESDRAAFCINGGELPDLVNYLRRSLTVRGKLSFLYFSVFGSKKKTFYNNCIQPFMKLDCIGNLAAFDTLNIDLNYSLIPKCLIAVSTFHPKPKFFSQTEGVYNVFFSEKLACTNANQIHVIPYSKLRTDQEYRTVDGISLHYLGIDKVNFYSPLYRSIVPDHIMNLKGAQITSGILLDILNKIGGEIDDENCAKKHVLTSSLSQILGTLENNKKSTFPYRNEINGGINCIPVASSFLRRDLIRKSKILYIETESLVNVAYNFLLDFSNSINFSPNDLNLKMLVGIILKEILIFVNFFKGSLNLHTASLPETRKHLKELICKDLVPLYDLTTIVNQMTNPLNDLQMQRIIERYIVFEYGSVVRQNKILLDFYIKVVLDRDPVAFVENFFTKYIKIFFNDFKDDDLSKIPESIFFFQKNVPDHEFDAFISLDKFIEKITKLANIETFHKKHPVLWSYKILILQTKIFSTEDLISCFERIFMKYRVLNLLLFNDEQKEIKCKIVEGTSLFTETVQFVQKNEIIRKIDNNTPKSNRCMYSDGDWARLQAGLGIYANKPTELLSDIRFCFTGSLDVKKIYSKLQALKRMAQERKSRIEELAKKFDIKKISFRQIMKLMVILNRTIFDRDLIKKAILMLHNCRLLTESQLRGISEIENFDIFCNTNQNTGSEWERVDTLIDIEVENYLSDQRNFLNSLNVAENVSTDAPNNQNMESLPSTVIDLPITFSDNGNQDMFNDNIDNFYDDRADDSFGFVNNVDMDYIERNRTLIELVEKTIHESKISHNNEMSGKRKQADQNSVPELVRPQHKNSIATTIGENPSREGLGKTDTTRKTVKFNETLTVQCYSKRVNDGFSFLGSPIEVKGKMRKNVLKSKNRMVGQTEHSSKLIVSNSQMEGITPIDKENETTISLNLSAVHLDEATLSHGKAKKRRIDYNTTDNGILVRLGCSNHMKCENGIARINLSKLSLKELEKSEDVSTECKTDHKAPDDIFIAKLGHVEHLCGKETLVRLDVSKFNQMKTIQKGNIIRKFKGKQTNTKDSKICSKLDKWNNMPNMETGIKPKFKNQPKNSRRNQTKPIPISSFNKILLSSMRSQKFWDNNIRTETFPLPEIATRKVITRILMSYIRRKEIKINFGLLRASCFNIKTRPDAMRWQAFKNRCREIGLICIDTKKSKGDSVLNEDFVRKIVNGQF